MEHHWYFVNTATSLATVRILRQLRLTATSSLPWPCRRPTLYTIHI